MNTQWTNKLYIVLHCREIDIEFVELAIYTLNKLNVLGICSFKLGICKIHIEKDNFSPMFSIQDQLF